MNKANVESKAIIAADAPNCRQNNSETPQRAINQETINTTPQIPKIHGNTIDMYFFILLPQLTSDF